MGIRRQSTKYGESIRIFEKAGALRAIDPFCNLATVNYLLAGMQLYGDIPGCSAWRQFIRDIGGYRPDAGEHKIELKDVLRLVREIFVPFGVPRGSDYQGGQTQGTNAPNVFPVDHVTSMLMYGKCINMINMWRAHDVSNGDDMILVLKKMIPTDYVLSRQKNSYNRQKFAELPRACKDCNGIEQNIEQRRLEVKTALYSEPRCTWVRMHVCVCNIHNPSSQGVWQLVPQVFDPTQEPENGHAYDYRENGYWHICRALQMSSQDPQQLFDRYNDATRCTHLGALQISSSGTLFLKRPQARYTQG